MIKLTVLYGQPIEPAVFEKYYAEIHTPIAQKMTGMEKVELTKFLDGPDGSKPSHYRMAEFWFTSPEALTATTSSPEGQAAVNDLSNFATGGVEFPGWIGRKLKDDKNNRIVSSNEQTHNMAGT